MTEIAYDPKQVEYATSNDIPLVTISVDRRHCTGPNKGVATASGPAPDDFTKVLLRLIEKFPERFGADGQ